MIFQKNITNQTPLRKPKKWQKLVQLIGFLAFVFSLVNFWGDWVEQTWILFSVSLFVFVVGSLLCIEVTLETTQTLTVEVPDELSPAQDEIITLEIQPRTVEPDEEKQGEQKIRSDIFSRGAGSWSWFFYF